MTPPPAGIGLKLSLIFFVREIILSKSFCAKFITVFAFFRLINLSEKSEISRNMNDNFCIFSHFFRESLRLLETVLSMRSKVWQMSSAYHSVDCR